MTTSPKVSQVRFALPAAVADSVANLLGEEYGAGLEVRDRETVQPAKDGLVELIVWLDAPLVGQGVERVQQYVQSLRELGNEVGDWLWSSEEAPEENWQEAYQLCFNQRCKLSLYHKFPGKRFLPKYILIPL